MVESHSESSPTARLWPVDWAHISFLVGSIVLLLIFWDQAPKAGIWVLVNLGLLGALVGIHRRGLRASFSVQASWKMCFTTLCIPIVFTQLGSLVPYVNPAPWEQRLFDFDEVLFFGANPLEALEALANPLLTELLQWVYDFYYLIALILGVMIFRDGRALDVARMNFAMTLCIYLSYVGYYVVPATGPNIDKHGLYDFDAPLHGIFMAHELRETIAAIEQIKQDCFPSGHTAVSVLALLLAYRFARPIVPLLWPLVVALVFSTMYLRYHYVADVIAGVVLAFGAHYGGLALHARFERRIGLSD